MMSTIYTPPPKLHEHARRSSSFFIIHTAEVSRAVISSLVLIAGVGGHEHGAGVAVAVDVNVGVEVDW